MEASNLPLLYKTHYMHANTHKLHHTGMQVFAHTHVTNVHPKIYPDNTHILLSFCLLYLRHHITILQLLQERIVLMVVYVYYDKLYIVSYFSNISCINCFVLLCAVTLCCKSPQNVL